MTYQWHIAADGWSAWNGVAILFVCLMAYAVWRLWCGMRLDPFERGIRSLRQRPDTTVLFFRRRPTATQTQTQTESAALHSSPIPSGRISLQISLLPLILFSGGVALLIAQATRPDEMSRPVTWLLFIFVASWYSTSLWPHARGIGPLRNYAWAGVLSAAAVSTALWVFYMSVDAIHQDVHVGRFSYNYGGYVGSAETSQFVRWTASGSVLLWWTAVGAVVGAVIGGFRANRIYRCTKVDRGDREPLTTVAAPSIAVPARNHRTSNWKMVAIGCAASLLFHLSAAPKLFQTVRVHVPYWYWGNLHHNFAQSNLNRGVTLTMPSIATSQSTHYWVSRFSIDDSPLVEGRPPIASTHVVVADSTSDINVETVFKEPGAPTRLLLTGAIEPELARYFTTQGNDPSTAFATDLGFSLTPFYELSGNVLSTETVDQRSNVLQNPKISGDTVIITLKSGAVISGTLLELSDKEFRIWNETELTIRRLDVKSYAQVSPMDGKGIGVTQPANQKGLALEPSPEGAYGLTNELPFVQDEISKTFRAEKNAPSSDVLPESSETELVAEDALQRDVLAAEGELTKGPKVRLPLRPENELAPNRNGFVTKTGGGIRQNLLEISLGSDDGVGEGMEVFVYRQDTYVGKAVVRRATSDFAVAEVKQGIVVAKGDRVSTRLKPPDGSPEQPRMLTVNTDDGMTITGRLISMTDDDVNIEVEGTSVKILMSNITSIRDATLGEVVESVKARGSIAGPKATLDTF